MSAIGAGDEAAFESLLNRHERGVINFFFRLSWDRALAEDLAQEVFVKLYSHAAAYKPQAKFTTYLYRVARNCWIDHCRRTKGEGNVRSLDAESENGTSFSDTVQARVDDPMNSANRSEVADAVVEAIDELPEDHKIVFVLSEVQGMRYQEISEVLSIPVGTVKSRMFHAIKRLRDQLTRSMKGVRGPWNPSESEVAEAQ